MVDVQRDKYWTNQKGRFCINLWILFPKIGVFSATDVLTAIYSSENFDVCERLGKLATGSDYWWKLKPGWLFSESRLVNRLVSDLREKWASFGKPWFESIPDLRAARDYLAAGWGKGVAISMSLALGETAEARELFIDTLCRRYRPPEDVLVRDQNRGLISEVEAHALRRLLMQDEDTLQRGLEELFGRSRSRSAPPTSSSATTK